MAEQPQLAHLVPFMHALLHAPTDLFVSVAQRLFQHAAPARGDSSEGTQQEVHGETIKHSMVHCEDDRLLDAGASRIAHAYDIHTEKRSLKWVDSLISKHPALLGEHFIACISPCHSTITIIPQERNLVRMEPGG